MYLVTDCHYETKIHSYNKHFWISDGYALGHRKVLLKMTVSMMTSSNGNIFRVTGHLCGKFTGPRWISRKKASDADLRLNKRLSKQPWGWWFETPAWSLWRHRNESKIKRLEKCDVQIHAAVIWPHFKSHIRLLFFLSFERYWWAIYTQLFNL